MRVLFLLLLCMAFMIACKPAASSDGTAGASKEQLDQLEQQVMAIHDEVMPKMNDIGHLTAQLKRMKIKLEEKEAGSDAAISGLNAAMEALKKGEDSMWDWMKAYGDAKSGLQPAQLEAFYKQELIKVQQVKDDMLGGIKKAQDWLAANPTE